MFRRGQFAASGVIGADKPCSSPFSWKFHKRFRLHSPTAQAQGIRTQTAHTARVHATTVPNFTSIRHRVAILQVKNRPTGVRNLLKVRTRKGTTFQPQLACEVHFHFLSVSAVWSQPAGP